MVLLKTNKTDICIVFLVILFIGFIFILYNYKNNHPSVITTLMFNNDKLYFRIYFYGIKSNDIKNTYHFLSKQEFDNFKSSTQYAKVEFNSIYYNNKQFSIYYIIEGVDQKCLKKSELYFLGKENKNDVDFVIEELFPLLILYFI